MTAPRLGTIVAGAALAAAVTASAQQQTGVFRAGARTVPVYVTVTGADGRLVTDLTKNDFEIFDNGRPQPITTFSSGIQPIRIVIMLDMSGSMIGNLPILRSSAVQMFTQLLPDDLAKIGSFGDRITVSQNWTRDENELIRALYLDLQPGGPTPLWGAVNVAMTALKPHEGRRVVLVLSDGKDSMGGFTRSGRSVVTLEEVSARAQNEDFMIYGIGLASRMAPPPAPGVPPGSVSVGPPGARRWVAPTDNPEPDPGLRQLANESGGGYIELNDAEHLGPAFARVADELHRQYLLGFTPPENDGVVHKIEVRVRGPQMAARARRTYVAPGGRTAAEVAPEVRR